MKRDKSQDKYVGTSYDKTSTSEAEANEKSKRQPPVAVPEDDDESTSADESSKSKSSSSISLTFDDIDAVTKSSKYNWLFILLLNLSLVGVLFGYAFMGGAVFVILEHQHNMDQLGVLNLARHNLKLAIGNLSICDAENKIMDMIKLQIELDKFEVTMKQTVCDEKVDIKGKDQWTFWSAVFFSATVISTIGKC